MEENKNYTLEEIAKILSQAAGAKVIVEEYTSENAKPEHKSVQFYIEGTDPEKHAFRWHYTLGTAVDAIIKSALFDFGYSLKKAQ